MNNMPEEARQPDAVPVISLLPAAPSATWHYRTAISTFLPKPGMTLPTGNKELKEQ